MADVVFLAMALPRSFGPWTAAPVGVLVTAADLPQAFPYLIAIERLVAAEAPDGTALLVLAGYGVVRGRHTWETGEGRPAGPHVVDFGDAENCAAARSAPRPVTGAVSRGVDGVKTVWCVSDGQALRAPATVRAKRRVTRRPWSASE